MKASTLVSAITAATLAVGSTGAIAQPRGEPQRKEMREHERREIRDREWHREEYRRQQEYRHRGDSRPGYRPAGGRGAGPRHDIYRGARLPSYYRTQHYVVQDWRYHRLPPPPRGHYWVQVGADYLLVAIATGIIVQLILAN